MKKSLLALAVLSALTGAAFAQSSVTLYGKVDLGLVLDSGNAAGKSVRLDSGVTGGSRIGFKGTEDLGGGNKASFQLETGYCADSAAGAPNFCTGSNNFMGRQAWGGLSGAFGTISAGRQYSLGFLTLTTIDPFGTGLAGQINNLANASGIRLNNSVQYTTPNFYGVTAAGEIALGEQTGNWAGGRETGGAVNYAQGPIYGSASYYGLDNTNGSGMADQVYQLGGTYDLGVAKAAALYQHETGSPASGAIKKNVWMLGATVPLAGGNLMASYVNLKDKTAADKSANQFGVGYMYPLSKRTSLYTAFAKINNKNGAAYTVGNATATGTGDKAFNIGAVHNF